MTAPERDLEAIERVFAALEQDPRQDPRELARRLGVAEEEVRSCAAALRALEIAAPAPRPAAPGWRPYAGDRVERYELLEVLGAGGMGQVWRAREEGTGREVAIKVALALRPSSQGQARLEREAEIMASLHHPHICAVHGAGQVHGTPWIALELVEGARTLDEVFRGLDLARRVALVRDASRALGHAHRRGVVHRDVKPENLLVDAHGRLRVADFGLALGLELERLTRSGEAPGTPCYMSPEQLTGEEVGPPADVWALGVVLYQAACDALPFPPGEQLIELMTRICRATPVPPGRIAPGVPPALDAICLRALARDPAARPADGEALAGELDRFLAGEAAPVPVTPGRRARLAVLAVIALAVLAGAVALRRSPAEPPASVPGAPAPRATPTTPAPLTSPAQGAASTPATTTRLRHPEPGPVLGLFAGDGQVVTFPVDDAPGPVRVWSAGALGRSWSPPAPLRAAALLPGPEPRLALATERGLWSARLDGEELAQLAPGAWRDLDLLLDPQGQPLLAASREPSLLQVFQLPPRQLHRREGPAGERIAAQVASPDRRLLALLLRQDGDAHRVVLLEAASGVEVESISPLPVPSRGAFSPDGRLLAIGCRDGNLLLARLGSQERPALLRTEEYGRAHPSSVQGLAFSADGRRLFSAAGKGPTAALRVWSLPDARLLETLPLEAPPTSLALSPDGRALLLTLEQGGALLLPVRDH